MTTRYISPFDDIFTSVNTVRADWKKLLSYPITLWSFVRFPQSARLPVLTVFRTHLGKPFVDGRLNISSRSLTLQQSHRKHPGQPAKHLTKGHTFIHVSISTWIVKKKTAQHTLSHAAPNPSLESPCTAQRPISHIVKPPLEVPTGAFFKH